MNFSLEVTARAAADVDECLAWWARERSVAQALRWYVGIRRAIREIADNPLQYAPAAEQPEASQVLREMHFGLGSRSTHRVVFQVDAGTVRVLAVRHAAQDELPPDELSH